MSYFLIFLFPIYLFAKDFGTQGHTFEIKETDFQEYLLEKITNLSKEQEEEITDRFVGRLKTPEALSNLSRAKESRIYYYDPSMVLNRDLKDPEGKLIVKKGTRVNPLDQVSLNQDLIFFDATDKDQLNWAKQFHEAKWILVKGSPIELEEQENRPVYFDQFGFLRDQLRFKSLPVWVTQEGHQLKIEEVPLLIGVHR